MSFLKHEVEFLDAALGHARKKLDQANQEYGETVAASGGDWAFDDPASMAAAVEANFREKDLITLQKLKKKADQEGVIEYPPADSTQVHIGTRVLVEIEGEADWFELSNYAIPGLNSEEAIKTTPSAPLGSVLLGKSVGDSVTWNAANGTMSGTIIEVDQGILK